MLPEFPQLPETPVARQVECVSCRHLFSTTEEIMTPFRRAIRFIRLRGRRLIIEHRSAESISQQQVHPESDAQASHYHAPEEHGQHPHAHDTIICPRCGTNNQNWAYTRTNLKSNWLRQPVILGGMLVILALLTTAWWQMDNEKVPLQYQVILLTLGVFLFLFILPQTLIGLWIYLFRQEQKRRFLPKNLTLWDKIPLPISIYLIYFFAIGTVLALITIFIPWGAFTVDSQITPERTLVRRIDDVLLNSTETTDSTVAPFQIAASTTQLIHIINQVEQTCNMTPITSIIVHLEAQLVSNSAALDTLQVRNSLNDLYALQTNFNTTCQEDLRERAIASVNELRSQQDSACVNDNNAAACELRTFLDIQIAGLSSLIPYMPDEVPLDVEQLIPADPTIPVPITTIQDVLIRLRPIAASPPSQDIATRIEENLEPLEKWAGTAVSNYPWFTAGGDYLEIWMINFGLAGGIAILTALIVAYNTADQARRHLPAPVFATVSRLSPVVIWEVANTLAIPAPVLTGIQWRGAQRNELGGIDLFGIFHDSVAAREYGFPNDYVRAQNYAIKSDRWGHIVEAKIVDGVVPPPPSLADPVHMQIPAEIPRP